jgi:glyoxylase-like metal-dependent hydrolase (beta-lactamase superfamily II)/8-oxo-dGTP pyrophosphatase MutT (NUDIX family)
MTSPWRATTLSRSGSSDAEDLGADYPPFGIRSRSIRASPAGGKRVPVESMTDNSRIRDASALLLRRGGEFYLARRAPQLRFFGNFFAAIGGAVSAVDGTREDRFARALLRETYEEVGLALFAESVTAPACRLLTPGFYPRGFDTRFFLVDLDEAAPPGAEPSPHPSELTEGRWASPARWLELWRRGEFLMVPPVILMLERLVEVGFDAATPASLVRRVLGELGEEIESHPSQPIWNTPLARLVYLRTPTVPPAEHTNTYLLGHNPAYVVDPATPHSVERETLLRCIDEERAKGRSFAAILLTHDHVDHVGAAVWLRDRTSLPIWAHFETAQQLGDSLAIDRLLADGEELPLGEHPGGDGAWTLRCVHTPGHARGHLCFLDSAYSALIAGDMVSTLSSILIDPTDGNLDEYEESLRRLIALEPRVILPAHGPADGKGSALLEEQLEHREQRSREVLAAVEAGASSVDQVVDQVYAAVPAPQRALAGRSVISILRSLHAKGDWVTPEGDLGRESGILRQS